MDRELLLRRRQGKRLKACRQQAGYRSARQAALENDWPESSYRAHEAGTRTIGLDDAERYARRFRAEGVKVTAKDILFEPSGAEDQSALAASGVTLVPKCSWVSASKMVDIGDVADRRDLPTIPIADLPSGDWLPLRVEGDSMDRIAPHGALILVNRADRKLQHHKFYVFGHRGEATFKRYADTPVRRLEPYSTNPCHEPIYPQKDFIVVGRVRRVLLDL